MAAVEAAVVVEESMVVVLVADTLEAEAGCAEVERAWPDPVSAVVVRVPFVDRPPLRDRMAG